MARKVVKMAVADRPIELSEEVLEELMADRLVDAQYSFLKKVVESAGESLGASAKAE